MSIEEVFTGNAPWPEAKKHDKLIMFKSEEKEISQFVHSLRILLFLPYSAERNQKTFFLSVRSFSCQGSEWQLKPNEIINLI